MEVMINIKNATKLKKGDVLIYTGNGKGKNEFEPFDMKQFEKDINDKLVSNVVKVDSLIKKNQAILDKTKERNKEFINLFKGGK